MSSISVDEFSKRVSETGILPSSELSVLQRDFLSESSSLEGDSFAKFLVRRKKLSKYQAQAIYQGKERGLIIGKYMLIEEIGGGAMGRVYRALDRQLKRTVALKRLRSHRRSSDTAVKRFTRESEIVAKLQHPNIVQLYDAGEFGNTHYLVMQYIEGRDLKSVVKEEGPRDIHNAISLTLEVARGLNYAHTHSEGMVIHRDIKPSNILLSRDGRVTILDMGLARLVQPDEDEESEDRLTGESQLMGTPEYISPEQVVDARRADHRSDIYSLGCTLYFLIHGTPPFPRDSAIKMLQAHCKDPPPSLYVTGKYVPDELNAAYLKMVAKKPDDRFQCMADVVAALEQSAALVAAAGSAVAHNGAAAQPIGSPVVGGVGNDSRVSHSRPAQTTPGSISKGSGSQVSRAKTMDRPEENPEPVAGGSPHDTSPEMQTTTGSTGKELVQILAEQRESNNRLIVAVVLICGALFGAVWWLFTRVL
jgi:eukaryotic-like serine/threonine-protein kinase